MRGIQGSVLAVSLFLSLSGGLAGQDLVAPAWPSQFPPPPATKLEGFQPPVGAFFAVAHENLGSVPGVNIEAVEMRDAQGKAVRGLIVDLGDKRSYVDEDEIPGLIAACDNLLQVGPNPTSLRTYEARYATHGNLELSARVSERGTSFGIKTGRFQTASHTLGSADIQQLRAAFATAQEKLAALAQ